MKKYPLLLMAIASANLTFVQQTIAEETSATVLPTLVIEAMEEEDPTRTYIDYDRANVTRNHLQKKQIPQTIDTLDVQKYKLYGSNDLSVMLQGTPGISTKYDMRGDGIYVRGFSADTGDIYRDGNRESGQVRRSTANVERIEILKGPASVLYGRSGGGGVINMVSKYANFSSVSSVGVYAGSYDNYGVNLDLNKVVADNWAIRLTGEHGDSKSFRDRIESKIKMISPSVTYDNHESLKWTAQYTYDKLSRVPDRGPSYDVLPDGTPLNRGFAQDGDYVDDKLQVIRSDLSYKIDDQWLLDWALSYREAYQNFDHFYLGTYCETNDTADRRGGGCLGHAGEISQVYYYQKTANNTLSNSVSVFGDFYTWFIRHRLTLGFDFSIEEREPKLANRNKDGSAIYGYVNPITGSRSSSRGSGNLKIRTHNYYESRNYGYFVQNLIGFTDQLDVMIGARFDDYESDAKNKLLNSGHANYKRTVSDTTFSPSLGVVWRPVDEHSLYASYNRSFAPFGGRVGVNSVSARQNLKIFNAEPQYNDQFEVGVKSEWLDGGLSAQLSVFNIRKHNIRYRPDPENDPYRYAVQGEQQSRGMEFSTIGRIADKWYIRGGYGITKATVKEDKDKPENKGKYLANVAKNAGNLFFRYLPSDNAYAEVGVTHIGESWTNSSNTTKLKGFNRFDAAFGYNFNQWRTSLAVTNVFDKKYWRSSSMPGTPLSVLLRVNYKFD